jgi:hypothetical protein
MIKGVVYQMPRETRSSDCGDPLAQENLETLKQCIPLFEELGLNAIFVCTKLPAPRVHVHVQAVLLTGIPSLD